MKTEEDSCTAQAWAIVFASGNLTVSLSNSLVMERYSCLTNSPWMEACGAMLCTFRKHVSFPMTLLFPRDLDSAKISINLNLSTSWTPRT